MLGPYYCLSKAGLLTNRDPQLRPKRAIAVLPGGVEVSPSQAEDFARQILGMVLKELRPLKLGRGRWWTHLIESRERRVFRTTLIDRSVYLDTLPGGSRFDPSKEQLSQALPERFWMSEVSFPNLFLANRAKLGEILVSPHAFPADDEPDALLDTLVAFRLPSILGWAAEDDELGGRVYNVTRWSERGHRAIHAPGHHGNWW